MDNKVRVYKTTSFVNEFFVMTPVSQFIRRKCFLRYKIGADVSGSSEIFRIVTANK